MTVLHCRCDVLRFAVKACRKLLAPELSITHCICRVPEEVPEEVAQLMNECLSYDPKMRPSAKQIYERLSAVQSGSKGSSGPSAPSSAPQSSAREASAPGAGAAADMPETQDEATVSSLYRELGMMQGPQKNPTPLGITRLPIKSAFDMSE